MRAWISPPPDVKAQLAPVAPHLPAIVPLGYESTTTATAYVDQSTGIVVYPADTARVPPTLSVDGTHARIVPVMATAMKATPASVKFAADKASSAGKLLMIVKTAAPIGLYTLALIIVRRRKPASTQAAVPGAAEALVHE
jgi:hypothetical protein